VPVDRLRDHEPLGFPVWAQLVAAGAGAWPSPRSTAAGADLLDLSLAVEALGRRLARALVEHAAALSPGPAQPAEVVDGAQVATLAPGRDHVARLVPAGASPAGRRRRDDPSRRFRFR
jgi:hypothetical protein